MSQTYNTTTIAKLLKLSERRVQQLTKEGIIPRVDRGKYELVPAVQGYIDYLRLQMSGEISADDIIKNKNRLTLATAELREIEKSKMEGDLISTKEVKKTWLHYVNLIKTKLLSFPNKAAPQMVTVDNINEAKLILKERIYEVLNEIANAEITSAEQRSDDDFEIKSETDETTTETDGE
jgi:phage terminase Nu1 subunit (DNA packaging protein)